MCPGTHVPLLHVIHRHKDNEFKTENVMTAQQIPPELSVHATHVVSGDLHLTHMVLLTEENSIM